MRIQKTVPAIAVCAVLLVAGCSQDETLPGYGGTGGTGTPLVISSVDIQSEVAATRTSSVVGAEKSIGVFLDNMPGSTANVTRNNVEYTNRPVGGWMPYLPDADIYLKTDVSNVCAYYPYDAAIIDATRVKLTAHLWGSGETPLAYAPYQEVSETSRTVNFSMKQLYAWLEITFKRGNMGNDITLSEFSLANNKLCKEQLFDIGNAVYNYTLADAGMLTFAGDIALAKNGTAVRNILLPARGTSEPLTGGLKVSVKVKEYGNRVLSTTLTGLTALQWGYKYAVTLTVNTGMIGVSAVEVMPWTETNVNDGAGNPLIPMRTPGINVPEEDINLGGTNCTQQDKRDLAKLTWAEGNLMSKDDSKPYDWAPKQSDYGYYYIWNSTYVADGNTTSNGIDPCTKLNPAVYGEGWRTPTVNELAKLGRCSNSNSSYLDSKIGQWFMRELSGVFLPYGGSPLGNKGSASVNSNYVGMNGYYWGQGEEISSSTAEYLGLGYATTIKSITIFNGLSVRCVKGAKQ